MNRTKKLLKAVPNHDAPEGIFQPLSFYTLEGNCKKCDVGEYNIIVTDYKHNKVDRLESIFRTQCLCCGAKDIYYARQIDIE